MYQIAHARGPLYMMWGFFPLFFFNSGTMYITLHLRVLQSKPSLRQLTWTGVTLPSMGYSQILASVQFSSVAQLSRIPLFAIPWTAPFPSCVTLSCHTLHMCPFKSTLQLVLWPGMLDCVHSISGLPCSLSLSGLAQSIDIFVFHFCWEKIQENMLKS